MPESVSCIYVLKSQQKQSNETVIIPETQRYSDFLESPRELMKVAFKYRTVREMTAFD